MANISKEDALFVGEMARQGISMMRKFWEETKKYGPHNEYVNGKFYENSIHIMRFSQISEEEKRLTDILNRLFKQFK